MADLSITAANCVVSGTGQRRFSGTAGEAIAAGKTIYLDPTSHKYMLADSNSATVAARKPDGIALNSAALNQPINGMSDGDLTLGATLTPNTPYYQSDTPGGICPIADVGSGEYLCQIGIAKSSTVLSVGIQATGVAN
ncbi:MAG: hypothetical protein J0H42_04200 [Rhizobiales bacterium]|nr:hypothetical protein [Hyphomicrobiales bacterium]